MDVKAKRFAVAAPVAMIVAISFLVVREASAQTEITPTTTIPSRGTLDTRVADRGADPSVLTKGPVAVAVLPTEQPRSVSLKVLATGSLKDRITSVINVCSAAFAGYESAQPVAAFATTAGDLVGWSPGRAKVLSPDFPAKRAGSEPVAMCYLDGLFGQKEPGALRERALWVIGIDGTPALYSIGALVDVGVANPVGEATGLLVPG